MEFSRPEHWSGLPFPSPGDLPNPRMKPRSPVLQADSLPAETQGNPMYIYTYIFKTVFIKYIYFFGNLPNA